MGAEGGSAAGTRTGIISFWPGTSRELGRPFARRLRGQPRQVLLGTAMMARGPRAYRRADGDRLASWLGADRVEPCGGKEQDRRDQEQGDEPVAWRMNLHPGRLARRARNGSSGVRYASWSRLTTPKNARDQLDYDRQTTVPRCKIPTWRSF